MNRLLPLLIAASTACAAPLEIGKIAPAPLLDGSPAEWSGLPAHALNSEAGKARVRFAQDRDNLYAFVEVLDTSPLRNTAARPQEMLKGGDAISFFITSPSGPQRVILGRHEGQTIIYTHQPRSGKKAPYVFTSPVGSAAFDYVGPLDDARAEFSLTLSGYNAEIALPWKALGFRHAPGGANEGFAFDFQVIFSDPAGSTNAGAVWLHATEGPGLTVEDLPTEATLYPDTWGQAVLVDEASALANTATITPVKAQGSTIDLDLPRAGRLTVNITDQNGWVLRELVLAEQRKSGRNIIVWDGRDRYGDPVPPGDYHWKALLFDGVGMKFLGGVGNSARPPFRTDDGAGSLGGQHGSSGVVAADAGGIYIGGGAQEGEPSFRKIDTATGKSLWKRSPGNFQTFIGVAAAEDMTVLLSTVGRSPKQSVVLAQVDPATGQTIKIAGRSEITIETDYDHSLIYDVVIAGGRAVYSVPAEKRLSLVDLTSGKKLPDIMIEAGGLCRIDGDSILACTKDGVIRVNLSTGQTTKIITGLTAPADVAVEPKTGNLFVSELGARQQILKYSPAGKPIVAIGRAGGKSGIDPTYDPMAFRDIKRIAFASDGTLWMKEFDDVPKRFVHITADGKWIEDFCGPVAYNTFGPDLDDVSKIYYNPSAKSNSVFVETKVDYDGYSKDPTTPGNWKITATHDLALGADGKTVNELMQDVAQIGYGHVIAFKADSGRRFLFRLSKPNRASTPKGAGLWVWQNNRWVPFAFLSSDSKNAGPSWRDANGDGLIQDGEYFESPEYDRYAWIGRDLVLNGVNGKLAPASIDSQGLPVYVGGKFTPYLSEPNDLISGGNVFPSPQVDGSVYYAVNTGPHRHLSFWDRATDNRVIKVTDGKIEWMTGINNPQDSFTSFATMSGVAGIVDDLVLVHNVEPSSFIAYTTDGMLLGNAGALPDGSKPKAGGTAIYIEHFTGLFIKDPASGRRMLFFVVSGDDRIVEITGPGRMDRFEGEITLPKGAAKLGGELPVIPYAALHSNVSRGLGIDGEDSEWNPGVPRLSISGDQGVVGDVRMRRDGGALNIIADIVDATPLQAGEGLEIAFGKSANRPEALLSFIADGGPIDAKNPWSGKVTLTRVGIDIPTTGLKIAAKLRWQNLGYHIEAEIPLDLLPQFAADTPQTYRHEVVDPRTGKSSGLADTTETLPDLLGPLFMNLRVLLNENGQTKPIPLASLSLISVTLPAAPVKK